MMRTPVVLAATVAALTALATPERDFELMALVDSFDFVPYFDIETAEGTVYTLEHVLGTYPTTVLWRDKGGGLMRYASEEEASAYCETPLDMRMGWRYSAYGDLRLHSRGAGALSTVFAECARRGIRCGIHTGWEDNHNATSTESNWVMAHPQFTCRDYQGGLTLARVSLAYPEVMAHKLALWDERLAFGPETIFLDLQRNGMWEPRYEYVKPMMDEWEAQHPGVDVPLDWENEDWLQLVSTYTHSYIRQAHAKCQAKGTKLLLGISDLDLDDTSVWKSRAIDWKGLAQEGCVDGIVVISVAKNGAMESTPFAYSKQVLDYAKSKCGSTKLYFQVSDYDELTYYEQHGASELGKTGSLSKGEAIRELVRIAKEAGCSGSIMLCVDYKNYTDEACDALSETSELIEGAVTRWRGANGSWSESANWTHAEAVDKTDTAVEFRSTVETTLDKGSAFDASKLIVRGPGSVVKVAATDGSALRLVSGGSTVDDAYGLVVDQGASLTLAVPVESASPVEKGGYGSLKIENGSLSAADLRVKGGNLELTSSRLTSPTGQTDIRTGKNASLTFGPGFACESALTFWGNSTVGLKGDVTWGENWQLASGAQVALAAERPVALYIGANRSLPEGVSVGANITVASDCGDDEDLSAATVYEGQELGSLNLESPLENAMIAVPFGEISGKEGEITARNIVSPAGLEDGVELRAFNGKNFDTWKLEGGEWVNPSCSFIQGPNGVQETGEAADASVATAKPGSAVYVIGAKGCPIHLYGAVAATSESITITGKAMVGNPTAVKASPMISDAVSGDQIFISVDGVMMDQWGYNGSEWSHWVGGRIESQFDAPAIGPGEGFIYSPKSGSRTISWK